MPSPAGKGDHADGVPEPSLPRFGVLAVVVDEESRLFVCLRQSDMSFGRDIFTQ